MVVVVVVVVAIDVLVAMGEAVTAALRAVVEAPRSGDVEIDSTIDEDGSAWDPCIAVSSGILQVSSQTHSSVSSGTSAVYH